MNAREANVLLTRAALIDARLRREPAERAEMAIAWAGVLADVDLDEAITAVNDYYAAEKQSIMPADIIAAVPVRSASDAGNVTELRLQREATERRQLAPGGDDVA